jgi:hypothetical protein
MSDDETPPILKSKYYGSPSAFTPESLLREARRQKQAASLPVPDVCLLGPDGDIVRHVKAAGGRGWMRGGSATIPNFGHCPNGDIMPSFTPTVRALGICL